MLICEWEALAQSKAIWARELRRPHVFDVLALQDMDSVGQALSPRGISPARNQEATGPEPPKT